MPLSRVAPDCTEANLHSVEPGQENAPPLVLENQYSFAAHGMVGL